MLKSAQEVFNILKSQHLEEHEGSITLNLMGISVSIKDKSTIGYIFQEWLAAWFAENNIDFEVNINTQEPPDFYLKPGHKDSDWLEVKTFNLDASANFDVANFDAYCRSLETKPFRLNADYLIFGYTFRDGILIIKEIWLKKIWEITSNSERFSVKTQVKQDVIYNIRPCSWWSKRSDYKPFPSKIKFVEALKDTQWQYNKTKSQTDAWLKVVKNKYKEYIGDELV